MSEAPPIDDCVDCEPEGDLTPAAEMVCENAMSRILQWSPGIGGLAMPKASDFKDACRGLCHKRAQKSKGCFKWVAERMGMHRITLKRIMDGTSPLDVIHIAALQGLIMTDWVRSEGVEPRDIYRPTSTVNLPRRLRARMPEPAPRQETTAASSSDDPDSLEASWEEMCSNLVEDGLVMEDEEFNRAAKAIQSISNKICMKYIREEKGAKGKHYVDHAVRIVEDTMKARAAN